MTHESLKRFSFCCMDLVTSKFILADAKISALLKCIAEEQLLCDIITDTLRNFDYEGTLASCCKDGVFELPKDDRSIIALVFCLLFDFDTKKRELSDFLKTYFGGNSNQATFDFGHRVVKSFKHAIEVAVCEIEKFTPDEEIFDAEDELSENLKAKLVTLAKTFMKSAEDSFLPEESRDALKTTAMGFASAVTAGNVQQIKVTFLGMKYTALYFRFPAFLSDIEKILSDCWIL